MGNAELSFDGSTISLPLLEGTEGERAINIAKLRAQTGLVTLDPGYVNTGSCESAITFIDGEKGILRYRGYPIEEVCEHTDFLETAFLLIYGTLPNQENYDRFCHEVATRGLLHEGVLKMLDAFPINAHPMAMLASAVSSLSAFYPYDTKDPDQTEGAMLRLLAVMPSLAAAIYRKQRGLPIVHPNGTLGYAANFINMVFQSPVKPVDLDEDVVRALDLLLILHADHEQNCSTATVRMVGSSQVNLYASIAGGICSLWGPSHGGANQAVLEMLARIHADGGDIGKYLAMAKDKTNQFRLMGFGHRVYKNFDPRARIIKKYCDIVLEKLGVSDPLLGLAKQLEQAALEDAYFVDRKLYPNVDFFSGIIYKALGIPVNMFTVMFAMGRLPGWLAQWRELKGDPAFRIGRPRQIYQGERLRRLESQVSSYR